MFLEIILSLIIILLIYIIITLYRKVIVFEDKITDTEEQIKTTVQMMRNIDLNGAFESDDEVGEVFRMMNTLTESLGEYIYGEETEE
jgi:predicted Holliday junction resolvase-like endonuclease